MTRPGAKHCARLTSAMADSRMESHVIRYLFDWICDRNRWTDLRRIPGSCARTLDCGGRDRAFGNRDFEWSKNNTSERSSRIAESNYDWALPVTSGSCSMNYKNKTKKCTVANYKAIIASVTKELARPRMTESTRMELDKQAKARDGVSACSDPPFTAILQKLFQKCLHSIIEKQSTGASQNSTSSGAESAVGR
jgi:hypothetical protein